MPEDTGKRYLQILWHYILSMLIFAFFFTPDVNRRNVLSQDNYPHLTLRKLHLHLYLLPNQDLLAVAPTPSPQHTQNPLQVPTDPILADILPTTAIRIHTARVFMVLFPSLGANASASLPILPEPPSYSSLPQGSTSRAK